MRISIEYPFTLNWKKGYLRSSSQDGRARVDLVNSNDDRTTISYARYLLSVLEARYLTEDEEVDHIDNDCSNDTLLNLQILSVEEHKLKTKMFAEGRTEELCTCACCSIEFSRESRLVRAENNFCSRSCNAKFNKRFNGWGLSEEICTDEQVLVITQYRVQGLSDYKISPLVGFNRSKVQRIRKRYDIS